MIIEFDLIKIKHKINSVIHSDFSLRALLTLLIAETATNLLDVFFFELLTEVSEFFLVVCDKVNVEVKNDL